MADRFNIATPRKKKDGGTYWVNIGTAWVDEKGTQLVFDALPIPDDEGRCVARLFPPRDDRQRSASNDARGTGGNGGPQNRRAPDLDEDIPFATNDSIW